MKYLVIFFVLVSMFAFSLRADVKTVSTTTDDSVVVMEACFQLKTDTEQKVYISNRDFYQKKVLVKTQTIYYDGQLGQIPEPSDWNLYEPCPCGSGVSGEITEVTITTTIDDIIGILDALDGITLGTPDKVHDLVHPTGGVGYKTLLTDDIELTGIEAPPSGQDAVLYLWNFNNDKKKIKLKHDDSDSLAVNRFFLPNEDDFEIHSYGYLKIIYRTDIQRWIIDHPHKK